MRFEPSAVKEATASGCRVVVSTCAWARVAGPPLTEVRCVLCPAKRERDIAIGHVPRRPQDVSSDRTLVCRLLQLARIRTRECLVMDPMDRAARVGLCGEIARRVSGKNAIQLARERAEQLAHRRVSDEHDMLISQRASRHGRVHLGSVHAASPGEDVRSINISAGRCGIVDAASPSQVQTARARDEQPAQPSP